MEDKVFLIEDFYKFVMPTNKEPSQFSELIKVIRKLLAYIRLWMKTSQVQICS